MAQYSREAVTRILTTLLASTEAHAARSMASREYLDGRASGIRSALEILAMDETDVLPKVQPGARHE